ncbi:MAG: hypothetical protein GM45_0390 [actinobacterium acAMD-5]|jgi:peroxiredoxin|nr:MAG: hypothetical protein GM45_0390 [actinobacterium acAMD-5]
MSLSVGTVAPEFSLTSHDGQKVNLSDYRGKKNVLVFFYPFAFTGTCTGEVCAVRDAMPASSNPDTVILAISCDPVYSLAVFAKQENVDYLLLSDFWPHGEVAKSYGVFLEERGMATRGSFIIDKEGVIRWMVINGPGEARDVTQYQEALAAL